MINNLCPHFYCKVQLIQTHPNKHPGTPHPVFVDLHNFWRNWRDKNWKSCSLSRPNIFEMKVTFVYEIRRPFG